MSADVTLFTDRSGFEEDWRNELDAYGLEVAVAMPDELPERVTSESALVIDAASADYDEDEVLGHAGLCRALGCVAAVVLPSDESLESLDDLIDAICGGLVARSGDDRARVAAGLVRRMRARRRRSFEYVAISPRPGELLTILADGAAVLLPRPAHRADDRTDIASITLAESADRATLELQSGARFEVVADEIAALQGARPAAVRTEPVRVQNGLHANEVALPVELVLEEVDGHRLGARIRALRLEAGLTQAELAKRTGIHRPNIARVEAGRHTPSLETLARLAAAIGVPTTRVLTGD